MYFNRNFWGAHAMEQERAMTLQKLKDGVQVGMPQILLK
jgi:hypothetical protein